MVKEGLIENLRDLGFRQRDGPGVLSLDDWNAVTHTRDLPTLLVSELGLNLVSGTTLGRNFQWGRQLVNKPFVLILTQKINDIVSDKNVLSKVYKIGLGVKNLQDCVVKEIWSLYEITKLTRLVVYGIGVWNLFIFLISTQY